MNQLKKDQSMIELSMTDNKALNVTLCLLRNVIFMSYRKEMNSLGLTQLFYWVPSKINMSLSVLHSCKTWTSSTKANPPKYTKQCTTIL
jgi:hypothetical protein